MQSVNLGTHLSGLLDQYQQYQVEATALDSWLNAQEQSQNILKPSGEQTDAQTLQNTLKSVQVRVSCASLGQTEDDSACISQLHLKTFIYLVFFFFKHLQDGLAEHSVQLEKLRNAGKVLTTIQESPKFKTADIKTTIGNCISIFHLLH